MNTRRLALEFSIAFLLLTGIFAGMGWLMLNRTAAMEKQLNSILDERWSKVQWATDALRYSSRNNRITMQLFLVKRPQDIAPLLAERARNSDAISDLLRQLELRADSDQEKKLLRAIWDHRIPYVDSYKEAMALLLDQGNYERARQKMISVTLPRLIDYHDAWEEFTRFQENQMKISGASARANTRSGREQMIDLLSAGALLTLGIWVCLAILLLGPGRPRGKTDTELSSAAMHTTVAD